MSIQRQGSKWWEQLGGWFGNTANLVALFIIVLIIINLIFEIGGNFFQLLAFSTLILMVFLRLADISRFRNYISMDDGVPPLGLAKGSVRALLAFIIIGGFAFYVYHVLSTPDAKVNDKIFTALNSILAAVIGFYFGTRATAAEFTSVKTLSPTVGGIQPGTANLADKKVRIENLSGTGFQPNAAVKLVKDKDLIPGQEVNVVRSNQITCLFDLSGGRAGKWDVVVTNPDKQTGTLPEGFEIR